MGILKCLSLAKLYIDYSACWWLHCHWGGYCRGYAEGSHSQGDKTHQKCSKQNSLSKHQTHNELIFPRVPFYSVRGDIDIHTSQQALCQFPSLIQICSERSSNPLCSTGCEDDSPSCLKRKLQAQYTRGSLLILRDVNAQDILERFRPNEVFSLFLCACVHSIKRLSIFMQHHTRAWNHEHTDQHLNYTFWEILLQNLTLRP